MTENSWDWNIFLNFQFSRITLIVINSIMLMMGTNVILPVGFGVTLKFNPRWGGHV